MVLPINADSLGDPRYLCRQVTVGLVLARIGAVAGAVLAAVVGVKDW
jgi:hypothetical protein